jgi:hypothetical protein
MEPSRALSTTDAINSFANDMLEDCEISSIQWIWIDSTETDVSILRSDTLGVFGCTLVTCLTCLEIFHVCVI